MADLSDPVVKANALAQAHPLGEVAYRYVGAMVEQERLAQPVEDIGIWVGHALTAGYCLRRVEEDQVGTRVDFPAADLPAGFPINDLPTNDLDSAVRHVAQLIRTEGAEPYLLWEETRLVELMDRLIASEINRRVGHFRADMTADQTADIIEYLSWWVIKGYALRVVEGDDVG